jgi:endonuclease/exonuclease/phosphatase family metal-dependent hydrolase
MRQSIVFGIGFYLLCVTVSVASADVDPLRVMTFTIRYGLAEDGKHHWRYRRDKVAKLVRNAAADVVGVQEAMHF